MIVTADLHLTEESEGIVFDQVLPGLVEAAKQWAAESNCALLPTIAILGDVYHIRYRVAVRIQNRLYNFLAADRGVHWILLPGNHDQINPAGEHALEVFKDLGNVVVKSDPGWDEHGLWVPYRKDPADIHRALIMTKPEGSPAIAWMHHGVKGAFMGANIRDTDGISMESFTGFNRVFCGHYHLPQDLGVLSYVGSPYQTRADEAGQQKRIGMWCANSETMNWSPENWGRRFFRIEAGPHGVILPEDAQASDELRVIASAGTDLERLSQSLSSRGFTNVVVTPVQEVAKARLQVESDKGLDAYAGEYVKQFGGELDQVKLVEIWRGVTA